MKSIEKTPLHEGRSDTAVEDVRPPADWKTVPPPVPGVPVAGHDQIDLNVAPATSGRMLFASFIALILLGALLIIGLLPRLALNREFASQKASADGAIVVNVQTPRRAPTTVSVTIPGNLRPWREVSVFARTTGYLSQFHKDISESVEAGTLLATIDSPEVDQDLLVADAVRNQAKTGVQKASTDRDYAKITYNRYESLLASNSVSKQDVDDKKAALAAAESGVDSANANLKAAEATVTKLTEMKSFEKVYAPFKGVVSGRAYDPGSLILASPTATDVKPLFKIAQNDVLRAFVNVPQSVSLSIRKGMTATVLSRERPGREFVGAVMGTTNYLDQANRTLLTEVKIPNPPELDGSNALLPGMFVQVRFDIVRDTPPLMIPAPAVVNNADGTQVVTIVDGKARYIKVMLGEDYGSEIEVIGGLKGDEIIIANPGERTVEGAAVVAAAVPATKPK